MIKFKRSAVPSLFILFYRFQCHEKFFIESLFHTVSGIQVVDGLSPSVLLVRSERELVRIFDLSLFFHVKMAVSLCFRVIAILILF